MVERALITPTNLSRESGFINHISLKNETKNCSSIAGNSGFLTWRFRHAAFCNRIHTGIDRNARRLRIVQLFGAHENWLRLFEQFPAKDKWASARLLSFSPMFGVTQGGRSPTVVTSSIGGGKFMPPPP